MILLVSDSKPAECALREVAVHAGQSVARVSHVECALAEVRNTRPALVIWDTDIQGSQDWRELLEQFDSNAIQVIVVSRVPTDALWAEVLNLGGFDVLALPFDRVELECVVLAALRHCQPAGVRRLP